MGGYTDVPPPDASLTPLMFAARWACRDIYAEGTPAIAAGLLEADYDSPSLRRLAGETQVRCSADVAELIERVMREFGLPVPFPLKRARLITTRQIAKLVIAGERDPWRASSEIAMIWEGCPDDEDVSAVLNYADEVVWDPDYQRFRPAILSDLLDAFARISRQTDEQIFG